jgi:hypothetical protein
MVVAPNGITSPLLVLLKKRRSRVAHHVHKLLETVHKISQTTYWRERKWVVQSLAISCTYATPCIRNLGIRNIGIRGGGLRHNITSLTKIRCMSPLAWLTGLVV